MARTLIERVQSALRNAAENGYHFTGWSAERVAEDMVSYDSDLEMEEVDDVARAIEKIWRKEPRS